LGVTSSPKNQSFESFTTLLVRYIRESSDRVWGLALQDEANRDAEQEGRVRLRPNRGFPYRPWLRRHPIRKSNESLGG
jgi:hypothetical protein